MEQLASLADGADAKKRLSALVAGYREWIEAQKKNVPKTPPRRKETGEELLRRAKVAADRIEAGIALLADAQVLDAFRLANGTVATAMSPATRLHPERRAGQGRCADLATVSSLAFLLMNLRGIAQPSHAEREVVDLLFFPTGGGKTEAYLGLAAFTLVLRRLRNPGIQSAGLSVLMRYTLRLLTLDQLSRAATLICALELERQKDTNKLGSWPFEIGLWVGQAATPNRMGRKGDTNRDTARAKTIAFVNDDRKPSPIPLEECPWCGTKFNRHSFKLCRTRHPTDLRVTCMNRDCSFSARHRCRSSRSMSRSIADFHAS